MLGVGANLLFGMLSPPYNYFEAPALLKILYFFMKKLATYYALTIYVINKVYKIL